MKPASLLKIVSFIAVMIAPLAALAVAGAVPPYGRPLPEFPKFRSIIAGRNGVLDQLGKATLDRSPATEAAIRAKSYFEYYAANFVDVDTIISGRDGWLFYKPELECVSPEKLSAALDQMDAMIETAKAGGIELIVSISPEKATIYPEHLHPRAKSYWTCKLENNRLWRNLLAQHPLIIDHAVPILAEKQRDPDAKLYFATDTHWTPFASSWAMRQLIGAVGHYDYLKLPPPVRTGVTLTRSTDLANSMLLLPGVEKYDQIDSTIEAGLSGLAGVPERRTVFLTDSFYGVIERSLLANFPGAVFIAPPEDLAKQPAALASADRIIVNTVEHSLLHRASSVGSLGWNSPLGQTLIARAKEKATRASQ